MNDTDKLKLLLITGYVRKCESLKSFKESSIKIPAPILNIIAMFYPKFRFQPDHPKFTVSDGGQTVSNVDNSYGTIIFGPFFYPSDEIIITVTFSRGASGHNGFGFVTEKFTEFVADTFNYDQENYSRMIFYSGGKKGNSWSGKKWKSSYFSEIASFDSNNSRPLNDNKASERVCIEMNMITKIGKLYNEAHPDYPAALIDLRCEDGIAMAITMGSSSALAITVLDQKFEYKAKCDK